MFERRSDGFEEWRGPLNAVFTDAETRMVFRLSPVFGWKDLDALKVHLQMAALRRTEIVVMCDSLGGNLAAALEMTYAMRSSGARVVTYVEREALSAASLVFAAGHVRLMAPGAQLGTHGARLWGGWRLTWPVFRLYGHWVDYMQKQNMDKLAGRKLPRRLFGEDMYYMNPALAMRLGLADGHAVM